MVGLLGQGTDPGADIPDECATADGYCEPEVVSEALPDGPGDPWAGPGAEPVLTYERDDFWATTSNKQLNFLQHIYRSLHTRGGARAAVVLPDNVLFEDGDGQRIRRDLMEKCNLHTILRLPTGIFYAQGVKTNVLFFERGKNDNGNTNEVWYYDLRTNMESLGKRNPLSRKHFAGFVQAYTGGISIEEVKEQYDGRVDPDKRRQVKDNRWQCLSREQIAEKNDSLDLGLIADESFSSNGQSADPLQLAKEAKEEMQAIMLELEGIIKELG